MTAARDYYDTVITDDYVNSKRRHPPFTGSWEDLERAHPEFCRVHAPQRDRGTVGRNVHDSTCHIGVFKESHRTLGTVFSVSCALREGVKSWDRRFVRHGVFADSKVAVAIAQWMLTAPMHVCRHGHVASIVAECLLPDGAVRAAVDHAEVCRRVVDATRRAAQRAATKALPDLVPRVGDRLRKRRGKGAGTVGVVTAVNDARTKVCVQGWWWQRVENFERVDDEKGPCGMPPPSPCAPPSTKKRRRDAPSLRSSEPPPPLVPVVMAVPLPWTIVGVSAA